MAEDSVALSEGVASTLPAYPFLFAFYPVARLYEENMHEVPIGDVIPAVLVVLGATGLLLAILTLAFRDVRKAALVTSATVLPVMLFGVVGETLEPILGDGRGPLLALSIGIVVVGVVIAMRAGPRLGTITLGLNVVSLVLVVLVSVPAVGGIAAELEDGRSAAAVEPSGLSTPGTGAPDRDIYHFVLDRYGSEAALEAGKGIDNSAFIGWLRDNGFQVVDDARANYTKTVQSLGSTLGMESLDDIAARLGPDSENLSEVTRRIANSQAGQFLQDHGYEYVHIGSWFNQTRTSAIADRSYNPEEEVSFGTTLYDTTVLPVLVQRPERTDDFGRKHADSARYQLKVLDAIIEEPGRKYVFAHILLPHDPYVFLEDGSFDPDSATYGSQLAYTNERLQGLVERMLAVPEDERPIIILQADEGPYPDRFREDQDGFDWATATDDEILSKFGILNAMYLPGPEGEAPLREDLSAVNTYPELFRRYFGAEMDERPDRVLASSRARPWDLLDITDRLGALADD
jgi:hypothetical protein